MAGLILGADIGQARDPTALAVVDGFDVVHLERLPLGTSYPAVAERVAAIAAGAGNIPVVVDATGIGRAVVDMLEARGLAPIAVILHGGTKGRVSGREVALPRASLFQPLQAAVEAGRLRVASGLPYGRELTLELLAARGGPSGAESRGRDHHGDLATAVALAVWGAGLGAEAELERCARPS